MELPSQRYCSKQFIIKQITTRINRLKKNSKNATITARLMVAIGPVMIRLVYLYSVP